MGDTSDRLLEGSLNNTKKMSDYIQTGLQEVVEVGIELLENNVENPDIKSLQDCVVELVRAEKRVKTFTNSVNDLKKSWKNGSLDDSVDVVEVLKTNLQAQDEMSIEESNVWDHEFMVSFVNQMKEFGAGDELLTKPSSNTAHDPDVDMELTQRQASVKCPITQVDMTDPVKDKICGHTFEKDAIQTHIKQCLRRHKTAKCPFPGCTNTILPGNLEENSVIKALLKRRKVAAPSSN